jgi:glycosyltransferase involved in cell wall biosynthesis
MTSRSLVSVVIPTYNRRQFVAETIDSVLAQTYGEIEVIVVDDGSTDGTGEYLKARYSTEPRFRYLWQENAERARARNTGIKAAQGEYVAFLDSDDLWLPEKLEAQMRLLTAHPEMVMAVSWFEFIDEQHRTLGVFASPDMADVASGDFARRMIAANRIGSPTPVIKREVLLDAGMFCPDCKVLCFEDWELWTRVSVFGRVGLIPTVLALHRIHPGNTEKPLKPENYLASVANMKGKMRPKHWKSLGDVALMTYWECLTEAPPQRLQQRILALADGVSLFGWAFCTAACKRSSRELVRFGVGPAALDFLRKLRARA